MFYHKESSSEEPLTAKELQASLVEALAAVDHPKRRERVLVIPPDYSRAESHAGLLTQFAHGYYQDRLKAVLPAVGTHAAMEEWQMREMFGAQLPRSLFRPHKWRADAVTVGEVPAEFVKEATGGCVNFPWPAQLSSFVLKGGWDLILSMGQVVPHEVIGMANYNKNIFVGTGGEDGINRSHFVGAVFGMEQIMGRADTPVRRILNYASDNFTRGVLPIYYAMTVVKGSPSGRPGVYGFYFSDDISGFEAAARLSRKLNIELLDSPPQTIVVWLDEKKFRSTWVGNKSIYRTRMAIADGGDLVVLAPGVKEFGEDRDVDRLIRRHGYRGKEATLAAMERDSDLRANLCAAAHLIHGSSEGRFSITYCPGGLSRQEVEAVHYRYGDLGEMHRRYNPERLKDGWNTMPDGKAIYYISDPALGLWALRSRFECSR